MDAVDLFGTTLSALLVLIALGYGLVAFAPVLWPALLARRAGPAMPRRLLFVAVVAALVYGVVSFFLFALLVPIEVYVIWIAPQLEEAGIAHGDWLAGFVRSARGSWWMLVPIAQLVLTWRITKHLLPRWAHLCAYPAATAPHGDRATR